MVIGFLGGLLGKGGSAMATPLVHLAGVPAILAGAGARGARDEVLALADALGAPVIKTLSGKAVTVRQTPPQEIDAPMAMLCGS